MPFVKITRDKRGYEQFSLVHTPTRRGKPLRPRVLYWYRTPPGVKVGRVPFDPAVRAALEAQNPDITFDWDKLSSTPVPALEVDWRERRRVERTAKQARRAERPEEGDTVEVDATSGPEAAGDERVPDDHVAAAQAPMPGPNAGSDTTARRRRRGRRRRQSGDGGSEHMAQTQTEGGPPSEGRSSSEEARQSEPADSTDPSSDQEPNPV